MTSYSWDFGDSGSSTLANPTHEYAAAGTYTVSLTVTGPGGSDVDTQASLITVTEPAPVAAFGAAPTSGDAPLTVAFTDASTGTVTSYSWDFGDSGSSTLANPTHEYTAAGTYTVSLTVTGPGGSDVDTQASLITVTEPAPVAAFGAAPTNGDAPLTVAFTDASTGMVTSYSWDFGDSGSSTLANPTHEYAAAGTYTVSLTVTGPGGSDVDTQASLITVTEPAPVAAFGAAPTSGDAPLTVTFTDASTGAVTSYSWDFGDSGSSTLANPTHEYTAAGTYTVILTVTGPGGSDVDTQAGLITVTEPAPVASFGAAPTSGDAPLTVAFTDASTGMVTSYSWDFGDSGSSTLANPTHEYAAAGTYTVSLTVAGPGGSDVDTQASLITVTEPAPVAAFGAAPTSGDAPLTVAFTDVSTGAVTSYSWDFGDSGSSTLANPTHEYTAAGTYTVSLTVTGPGGSDVDTQASLITVTEPAPVAAFGAAPTSGDAPLTVAFTDASTGAVTSYSWDFGDSGGSTLSNPTHEYTAAGTYTVSLTVTGPGGSDVDTQASLITVTEPAPVASFGAAPTTGDAPLTVAFTDTSSGAVTSYSWDFGDSGSSTLANPTHEYTAAGTYTVSLTVTGPGGSDVDTQASLIAVTEPAPVAGFGAAPTSGDAPLTVTFTDASTGVVTSYSWDFGDSGSSTLANPTHEFTDAGTYTVSLTVTGPGGSDVDSQASLITVIEPAPVASFGAAPTSGDAPLTVAFTDASTGAVTSYSWDFGDSGSSTLANPTHEYAAAGTYTVSLTVTGPGGSDVDTQASLITVTEPAPVAAFGAAPTNGDAPLAVAFTDASTGAVTSYSWDFGDSGSSTLANPTHEYTAAGTYTVSLTVTGPGGSDVDTQASLITVTEPAPVASFGAAPTSGDAPLTVAFTDASTGAVTSYSWDFGDSGGSTLANPSHEYTASGTYAVSLTVTGPGGSDVDTQASLITVTEPAPVAAFGAAPTSGDAPLTVAFTDASTGAVTSYSWDFGDSGSSTLANPTHEYTAAGTYTVSLTVTGPGGSDVDTQASLITVTEPAPVAAFGAAPTSGDAPLTVAFTDASTGAVTSYSWDFGDSGSSTLANPTYEYTAAGTYAVSLTVTGPGGSDVDTQASLITVTEPAPVAAFGAAPTSGDAPLTVAFTDASTGAVTSYSWDFGDSGSSTLANPTHEYTAAGTYTVSLTVTGPGGSDVETQASLITVTEPAPVAAFGAAPTSGDAPLTVAFTDASTGMVTSYSWDFGDSGISTLANPTHEYTAAGTYTVSLTVTGPGGSDVDAQASLITVTEPAPVAAFGAAPTSGDAPLTVAFTDASTGAVTSYSWDFGDSGSSTLANPTHEYAAAGTYTVSLTVTGPGGSDVDTQASLITVTEPAPVAAFGAAPTSGDAPLTVAFTDASTGMVTSYSWDFGDSGSSTLANPTHEYTAAGTYTVSLTVTGPGGSDIDTQASLITVTEPVPVAQFTAIPTMGQEPLLVAFTDASTGNVTSYSWDFGDSGSSTLANPTHEYATAGTYSVSLAVVGPGGSDVETKLDHIVVLPSNTAHLGVFDPDFEGQSAAGAPGGAWTVTNGAGHLVHPVGVSSDNGMPVHGNQWLEVSAEGTAATTPPSNPGGPTDPPVGGAGVAQTFRYPAGMTVLQFGAAFLVAERPRSSATNDWMSVDISDGVTTQNLYYADTFTQPSLISAEYGLRMTTVSSVSVDLATLFPASTTNTAFTLTVQVGNGGDGLDPSRGYFDDVRMASVAGGAMNLFGCGTNPDGSMFVVSGTGQIATDIVLGLDNPLNTQAPGTLISLFVSSGTRSNYPCGTNLAGLGMDGGPGELLVALGGSTLATLNAPPWTGPGVPTEYLIPIPNDNSLVGVTVYLQGLFNDPGGVVTFGLTQALELFMAP